MSSKTKKTTHTSSSINVTSIQSPQSTSTPTSGSRPSSSAGRPSSPLSPTRTSRLQEKADLQNLNDRLANYIDTVRRLENENSGLRREIQTTQETITREVSNIKGMYEHELQDARKLLDETSRDRAKLEIDLRRLIDENEDLKKRLDKKSKDFVSAENTSRIYEQRSNELSSKYNTAVSERKKAVDEAADLLKENEKLRKQLAETRKIQEQETLSRIEMENSLQSLKEELCFKDQVFQQELQETRTRRQVEISEIDGRLSQQYEAKLQQSLQELREQQDANIRGNREAIEALYENKLKALQAAATRNSTAAGLAVEEMNTTRSRIETLTAQLSQLESTNAVLNNKIRELEKQLENERARHAEDLAIMESELARLREEMADQLREYSSLMDIKCSLDLEIAAYRALIEGEESRLNLTPSRDSTGSAAVSSTGVRLTPSRRGTPLRGARKRTLLDESEERSLSDFSVSSSAKGDIEIAEVCPEGKFIKLHNKGNKETSLSGWQLVRRAGGEEAVYRFHRTLKLEPDSSVVIWSADVVGADHDPPRSIVMKSQRWPVADNLTTVLINNNTEEVAVSERQRKTMSSSLQRHREIKYPRREEIFHHQGDGDTEKCKIM